MKIKNKGKVYPSPSSSSSSSSSSRETDALSVLKLLPAAILALVSVLSFEDREVLAYLITRSMKTSSNAASATFSMVAQESKRRASKKGSSANGGGNFNNTHKPPVFDCDCFDCYRSYWLRWDSSPNRELMDQAIEAFEDQLTTGEKKTQKNGGRGKRREKMGRREAAAVKSAADMAVQTSSALLPENIEEDSGVVFPAVDDVMPVSSPEKTDGVEGKEENEEKEGADVEGMGEEVSQAEKEEEEEEEAEDKAVFVGKAAPVNNHKGLARKVLPDVLGLFNSRLWSLWGPNV